MTFLLDIDKSNTYLRVMRRSLLLLALLSSVAAAQTNFYAISPVVLNNGDSLYRNLGAISRTTTYNFPVTIAGEGHFSIRLYPAYNGITRGYLTIDSGSYIGISKFTLSVTGDSIQNVWLPDDTASIGFTGSIFKQGPGWSLIMVVKAEASGNGGILSIAKSNAIASVITPSAGYDVWLKRSDSLAVFVTPQWFWDNMIAGSGVTLSVLTDTVSARELALKNWADGKFLTGFTETDPGATPIAEAARDTASLANRQAHTALTKAEAARDTASEARLEVLNALLQTSDSLAARFKVTCDSLASLALRIGDTATAMRLWAAGLFIKADTGSLAIIGDLLYARSGGGGGIISPTDTLTVTGKLNLGINGWYWKQYPDSVVLSYNTGPAVIKADAAATAFRMLLWFDGKSGRMIAQRDGSTIWTCDPTGFWTNKATGIYGYSYTLATGLFRPDVGYNTGFGGKIGSTHDLSLVHSGSISMIARGNLTVELFGDSLNMKAAGASIISPRIFATDTLYAGNHAVYTYIIPGGDPVKSSTAAIKRNIVPVDTLPALLERFISVNPVRYQFKPVAFRTAFDTSMADGRWWSLKTVQKLALRDSFLVADSTRTETLAQRQMIGFLAEDLHAAGFTASGREYGNGELLAVLWRVVQRLAIRHRDQQSEIDDLKARVKALEAKR